MEIYDILNEHGESVAQVGGFEQKFKILHLASFSLFYRHLIFHPERRECSPVVA